MWFHEKNGCLRYIGDEILPSYIVIHIYKDPKTSHYQDSMESIWDVFSWLMSSHEFVLPFCVSVDEIHEMMTSVPKKKQKERMRFLGSH